MTRKHAPRVLLVDDEPRYCEKLERYLTSCGFEVVSANTANDAVLLGAIFEPQVVVADWMLGERLHGLQVVDAIRALHPRSRPIVMTGFPSADLRFEAEVSDAYAFIEKPFSPQLLTTAIELAIAAPSPRAPYPVLPFVVTDANGAVASMTAAAADLLACSSKETAGQPLAALFAPARPFDVKTAARDWVEGLKPAGRPRTRCVARARRLVDGRYFVVLGDERDAPLLKTHPAPQIVLDLYDRLPARQALGGNALVVDPDVSARSLVVCIFEELGALCHSSDTLARGFDVFVRDEDIRYIVLDAGLPGDLRAFASFVARRRPDAVIIAHGDAKDARKLADAGISRFIAKPWAVREFLDLVVEDRRQQQSSRRDAGRRWSDATPQ
jgi:DNA-binding response OmpR family regulator